MNSALDSLSFQIYGRKRSECILNHTCVGCGNKADHFRDELSEREYTLSGYCQDCQDEIFGSIEPEELM